MPQTTAAPPATPSASHPETQVLCAQLLALTTTLSATLRAQGATHATQLLSSGAKAQARVRESQAQALLTLNAHFDGAQADLLIQLGQAHAQVDAQAQADRLLVEQTAAQGLATGLQRLNSVLLAAETQAQAQAQAPIAIAEAEATHAGSSMEALALDAEQTTNDVGARHASAEHGDIASAAARSLGEQTAADLRSKAPTLQLETLEQGHRRADSNQAALDGLHGQLAALPTQLEASLSGLGNSARSEIDALTSTAHTQLNSLGEQAQAALEQARQAAQQALSTRSDTACQQIDAQSQAEAQGAQSQANTQAAQVESATPALLTALAEADPASTAELFSQAEAALSTWEIQAFDDQDQSRQEAESDLGAKAEAVTLEVDPSAELAALNAQTSAQIAEVTQAQAQGGEHVVSETYHGAEDASTTLIAEAESITAQTLDALRTDNADFQAELAEGVSTALTEAAVSTQDLAARAEGAARLAAEEAAQPWWQGLAAGLWAALDELVAGLAVFVTLTAALVLLAVAITGGPVTLALAGACAAAAGLFLLVHATIQAAVTRLSAGQGALWALALAAPDALGLTAIYEAITGDDTHSDQPLSATDRWRRGTQSLLTVLELVLTHRSRGARGEARNEGVATQKAELSQAAAGENRASERSATNSPQSARRLPQGISAEAFDRACALVQEKAGHFGGEIMVQGSRARGTARPDSDLDIAILVTPERFDAILRERFKQPNPGSSKERTLNNAIATGKIQSGECGLSGARKALEQILAMNVDISVIRRGGPFDQAPYIPMER